MTKNELKAALDSAGVKYRAKATLEGLRGLYAATVADGLLPTEAQVNEALVDQGDVAPANAATPEVVVVDEFRPLSGVQVAAPTDDAVAQHEAVVAAREANGLKIEKERPEQNGIKRPSIGGKCRAIWDALDAYQSETGDVPDAKVVKALAADEGWNPNNASIEFYQWRKYHGIGKQA